MPVSAATALPMAKPAPAQLRETLPVPAIARPLLPASAETAAGRISVGESSTAKVQPQQPAAAKALPQPLNDQPQMAAPPSGVPQPPASAQSTPAIRTAQIPALDPSLLNQPGTPGAALGETKWELKKISEINPYPDYDPRSSDERVEGNELKLPSEYSLTSAHGGDASPYSGRLMPDMVFQWEPSNLFSNPLYFQDVQLERYGHTHHPIVQPFASVGLFGAQFLGLPYQMTLHPFRKHEYVLGYYRPGDPAPRVYYQIPLNAKAAAVQAAVTTGAVFLFP